MRTLKAMEPYCLNIADSVSRFIYSFICLFNIIIIIILFIIIIIITILFIYLFIFFYYLVTIYN